jgi:hypothetical protein
MMVADMLGFLLEVEMASGAGALARALGRQHHAAAPWHEEVGARVGQIAAAARSA